jgi:hypothetical protein
MFLRTMYEPQCRYCGGEKAVTVSRADNPNGATALSRQEPVFYFPASDERIDRVYCTQCGLLYILESIGRIAL